MNPQEKKLFLLDAYALIFRGFFAFEKNPRINSKGMNTSAIFGFMNTLFDLLRTETPTHIGVCFDVGRANVRTDYYPEYKSTRNETPEPITQGVPYIQKILEALQIPILYAEGYEADDVIGTLAQKAEKEGYLTYMMTSDKDFAQLVTENIKIYKPAAFGKGPEIWGVEEVKNKFEISDPKQVIDYLGMMGDSVDNIPGLPGVGEKTAKKFIADYGSMENLLAHTHELKGKLKEKIEENKELGMLSKRLATIITDVPVVFDPEKLVFSEPRWDEVQKLFDELEFRRLTDNFHKVYQKLSVAFPTEKTVTEIPPATQIGEQIGLFEQIVEQPSLALQEIVEITNTDHYYQFIDTEKGLSLLVEKLIQQKEVSFDCETTSLNTFEAELVGMSFCYEKGKGYYVVFPSDKVKTQTILEKLKPFFESDHILKIGHNLKYDLKVLANHRQEVKGPFFDTMIAHYLLEPDMRHNMDALSEIYLGYKAISIENLIGKKGKNQASFRDVPLEEQTEYAVEDADVTLQLKNIFETRLKDNNLSQLFYQTEMPLMLVLKDMEIRGIRLDAEALHKQSDYLQVFMQDIEKEIYSLAGEEFNLNSPKQLGEILFDKLKLSAKAKKTKTGQYATSEEVLAKLAPTNEIVNKILSYRQMQKLKSTYLDALPKEIEKSTGRIHTIFSQTVASTGRLASNNPNLQNIPIRTEQGRQVRSAFIPQDEKHVLLAADYSQIELRLIAALSKDPVMVAAFRNNEDIHASTAAKVFHTTLDKVTREQRSVAKTINFGIIYGVSAFGLSEQTNLSRSESKAMIDAYYETYPVLKTYMSEQIEKARKNGYVETILGRRRYLPDINSNNVVIRSHAERNAINAPIQGSAADIIKTAMIDIQKAIKEQNLQSRLLLQVHDELVFDVPESEVPVIRPLVKSLMEQAHPLEVPLIVEIGIGKNWLEAH